MHHDNIVGTIIGGKNAFPVAADKKTHIVATIERSIPQPLYSLAPLCSASEKAGFELCFYNLIHRDASFVGLSVGSAAIQFYDQREIDSTGFANEPFSSSFDCDRENCQCA